MNTSQQKFGPVVLDDDEDAVCPVPTCTFNKPDLHFGRRGFTASLSGDGTKVYTVYCPYCR